MLLRFCLAWTSQKRPSIRHKRKLLIACVLVAAIVIFYLVVPKNVQLQVIGLSSKRIPGTSNPQHSKSPVLVPQDNSQLPRKCSPTSDPSTALKIKAENSPDKIPLYKDLNEHEPWPEIERPKNTSPAKVPQTVHYLWCGQKQFLFTHYLAIMSAVRLLKPALVVFHYTHLPVVDGVWYNVWFQKLKQSLIYLELQQLQSGHSCDAAPLLDTALNLLAPSGDVYISHSTLLARHPADLKPQAFWFSRGQAADSVLIMSLTGFNVSEAKAILGGQRTGTGSDFTDAGQCVSVMEYNKRSGAVPCVTIDVDVHPKDIWDTDTPFAQFARWLFYGHRQMLQPKPSPEDQAVPRIGHVTFWKEGGRGFDFVNFLSVLSALHVGGMQHVYVHGDCEPEGEWWDKLRGDQKVSFVIRTPPRRVFQQEIKVLSHMSDIARTQILHDYGGIYFDSDVIFATRIPDLLLRYQTVLCPDWPANRPWPETFNMGVMISQAGAPWLRHFLSTFRHFVDENHSFNPIFMPYRVYENYPDTLFVDRHLQIICFNGVCHPAWHDDYIRGMYDTKPVRSFDWQDAKAYHFTEPKVPPSLQSPKVLAKSSDMLAELGKQVLVKAGRLDLLQS